MTITDDLPNVDPEHFSTPSGKAPRGSAPSAHRPRILLLYGSEYLTDRYSERVESAEEVSKRFNQRSM